MGTKFSQFPDGGDMQAGDRTVGLRNGQNYEFTFPGTGINDENGNPIFTYESSEDAVNYLNFENADTGNAPKIEATGQDATVGLDINTKGNGDVNLNMGTGDLIINDSVGINEISDDDTFTDASDSQVSTSLAVKTYVDNTTGDVSDSTFITKTDETADLPNSIPLSGLASGILSNTTSTGVLNPRTITGTANQVTITNGDGVSGNPTASLPNSVVLPGTITTPSYIFNSAGTGYILQTDNTTTIANDSEILASFSSNAHNGISLRTRTYFYDEVTFEAAAPHSLAGYSLTGTIFHASEPDNNIDFETGTQIYNIGGSAIFDITASGLRLGGAGARVNNIDNTGTSFLSTDTMTALGIQTAISDQIDMGTSFRGGWDASGNVFPSTGGTGGGGDIESGNWWYITVAGTLDGIAVALGDEITALVDTPGQTGSNWLVSVQKVTSVFGRDGPVVAEDGDYSYDEITGLPDTAASGKLMRGNGTAWVETTASFANTYNQYDILYASSANTVTGLAKAQNAVLTSDLLSVPAWVSLGNFQFLGGSGNGPKPYQIQVGNGMEATYNSGTTPGSVTISLGAPVSIANGGTNTTSAIGASGTLARSDGTKYTFTTATYPSTAGTSGNVLTSDGTNFVSSPPTLPFNTVTTSTQSLAINNTYYTTYAGLCTMTLPTTAAVGSVIEVYAGPSGNTFRVAQNASQYIYYGAQGGTVLVSATGTGGYIQSVDPATTVKLVCVVADVGWMVTSNVNDLDVNV